MIEIAPLPLAEDPPEYDDGYDSEGGSIDDEIAEATSNVPTIMTPTSLGPLFDTDYETDAYDPYVYQGKYVIPDVKDKKWKHIKKSDRADIDMGIMELAQVVGDKRARDVRRRGPFTSPLAFAAWQEKYDPKKRYRAYKANLDGYGENEFVVEHTDRYGNKKLVAVNGWTTKKSDYPLRSEWFEANPTHEERKANKWKKFINDKYRIRENMDDYDFPNHNYLESRAETLATSKYDAHMPKWTARGEFMREIIWAGYKKARDAFVANGHKAGDIKDKCDAVLKPGWVVRYGTKKFNDWIVNPFMNALRKSAYYQEKLRDYPAKYEKAMNAYNKGHPDDEPRPTEFDYTNPKHKESFEKGLMKNDTVRMGLNAEVRECLKNEAELKKAEALVANELLDLIGRALNTRSPRGSPPREHLRRVYQG